MVNDYNIRSNSFRCYALRPPIIRSRINKLIMKHIIKEKVQVNETRLSETFKRGVDKILYGKEIEHDLIEDQAYRWGEPNTEEELLDNKE